jgi:chromate transporter
MALVTPALLIIPLLRFAGVARRASPGKRHYPGRGPESAGILWAATVPIAREAVDDPISIIVVVVSTIALLSRKVESVWVILFGALAELTASSLHLIRN